MATYFLPRVFANDTHPLAKGGLIDQMFNASFPWKIMQAFADDSHKEMQQFMPSLDVLSDDKAYTINAEIPGVSCDNVKLEVKNGMLILQGEKQVEKTEGDPKNQHVTERSFGSFYRELSLPEDADTDNITATHKDGVLNINIPKISPKDSTKSISIARG